MGENPEESPFFSILGCHFRNPWKESLQTDICVTPPWWVWVKVCIIQGDFDESPQGGTFQPRETCGGNPEICGRERSMDFGSAGEWGFSGGIVRISGGIFWVSWAIKASWYGDESIQLIQVEYHEPTSMVIKTISFLSSLWQRPAAAYGKRLSSQFAPVELCCIFWEPFLNYYEYQIPIFFIWWSETIWTLLVKSNDLSNQVPKVSVFFPWFFNGESKNVGCWGATHSDWSSGSHGGRATKVGGPSHIRAVGISPLVKCGWKNLG